MTIEFASDFSAARTREERIALATHVPSLFGFAFICQHQPASGTPVAVMPGDAVGSSGASTVVCPDGIKIALEDKASLFLRQFDGMLDLTVVTGVVRISFGKNAFTLRASDLRFFVEGKNSEQELEVRPANEAMAFICNKGSLTALMKTGPNGARNFLGSKACRMEVRDSENQVISQVLPGDAMAILNRTVPREFLPRKLELFGGQEPSLPMNIWLTENNMKLAYSIGAYSPGQKAACELLLQEAPGGPAKVVNTFTAEGDQGALPLMSPKAGHSYFMVCEVDGIPFPSPLLTMP